MMLDVRSLPDHEKKISIITIDAKPCCCETAGGENVSYVQY